MRETEGFRPQLFILHDSSFIIHYWVYRPDKPKFVPSQNLSRKDFPMKKLLLPLLLCGLIALLLCACTNTTPPDETLPDTTSPVTEAPADPATEPPTEEPTETPTEESTEAPTEEVTTDYFEANSIEIVTPDPTKFADLTLTDEGYDIYQLPGNGNGGWRYGPSYIYYGDGRVDAYFASGGDSGEWDRITHRSSHRGSHHRLLRGQLH